MSFLRNLFGSKPAVADQPNQPILGLSDPNHIAREQICAAIELADSAVILNVAGGGVLRESSSGGATMNLVAAIDRAIEKSPSDQNLLLAKSSALCLALQFKSAEDVLDEVLKLNPDNFEANQLKAHWEEWGHVFAFPPWSETAQILHPVMKLHCSKGRSIQIVRDGLQLGVAVLGRAQLGQFPKGLSNKMRSKWEVMWSETPPGAIIAHYLMVEDNPGGDPFRSEAFLPLCVDEANRTSELLRRINCLGNCFLVLADGERVIYNARYGFPNSLKNVIRSCSQKVLLGGVPKDLSASARACQWHMNNFDMKKLRF